MTSLATPRQAYDAIANYLETLYAGEMTEDIGLMMLQIENRNCLDEWDKCLAEIVGGAQSSLTHPQAFDVMRAFVRLHYDLTQSSDYHRIWLDSEYQDVDAVGVPITPAWAAWAAALSKA